MSVIAPTTCASTLAASPRTNPAPAASSAPRSGPLPCTRYGSPHQRSPAIPVAKESVDVWCVQGVEGSPNGVCFRGRDIMGCVDGGGVHDYSMVPPRQGRRQPCDVVAAHERLVPFRLSVGLGCTLSMTKAWTMRGAKIGSRKSTRTQEESPWGSSDAPTVCSAVRPSGGERGLGWEVRGER